jgi:hypothetical protein
MSCDINKLKKWLQEAEEAYHQLMTGGSVRVFVDQNAERLEYTAANKQNLFNYITQLRAQICAIDPSDPVCACGVGRGGSPMGFTF